MIIIKLVNFYKSFDLEAVIWIGILIIVAFQDPYSSKHLSLFWPSLFFDIQSPGYNLGHSMSFFFRGEFLLSIKTHYLGIPCISIIIYRIITIIKMKINEWE